MERNKINQNETSGVHSSYWIDSESQHSFTSLNSDEKTDVVVIGGGIAGLSVAYNLVLAGKNVILIEDGNIGSGETGRTSAHLVTALDDRYYSLEKKYGKDKTKQIAASHIDAIDFIEKIVHTEEIDCEFKRIDGYLFPDPSDDEANLDKEFIACLSAGLEVQLEEHTPAIRKAGRSIRFGSQAKFHPLKYLNGLCEAILSRGGKIYTQTRATEISKEGIKTAEGFNIKADHIVIATNIPVKHINHFRQHAYRTYVVGVKVSKDTLPDVLWWDTGNQQVKKDIPPYHYVRLETYDDEHDLLMVGGEDHLTGLASSDEVTEEHRYEALEKWTREHFLNAGELVYRWSGQIIEPVDSLAYIGKFPKEENIYMVTSVSGNGLTYATIAGMMIADLVEGKTNVWQEIYDPSRSALSTSAKAFVKELVATMWNYMKSKPADKENDIADIPQGEGRVIAIDGNPYAVYRDAENYYHFIAAECSHQKCIVKWNNDEKSWDCPCHGSRFTYEGVVINGPANKDLPYHKVSSVQAKME